MRLAILTVCVLFFACGSDDPTQVMVQVQADSMLRAANGRLEIRIEGGESEGVLTPVDTLEVDSTAATDFPYVVALAPRGNDATRRWRATATLTGDFGSVSGTVEGTYDPGRVVQVDLFLTSACIDISCAALMTCVAGLCADSFVDVAGLPDYEGPMPRDAGSASDVGVGDGGGTDTNVEDAAPDVFDAGFDTPPIDAGLDCDPGFDVDLETFTVRYSNMASLDNIVLDVDGPGAPTGVFEDTEGMDPFRWRFRVTQAAAGVHTLTIRADPLGAVYGTCQVLYSAAPACGMSCTPSNSCLEGVNDCSTGSAVCITGDPSADGSDCELGGTCQSGICNIGVAQIVRESDVLDDQRWGESIDVSGDLVVIGVPDADRTAPNAGLVYVYDLRAATFEELTPPLIPAVNDAFGRTVAIRGGRVAASIRQTNVLVFNAGASWSHLRTLVSTDLHRLDDHVWIDGDRVLASGRDSTGDTTYGTVYEFNGMTQVDMFRETSTDWAKRFDVSGAVAASTDSGDARIHERSPTWALTETLDDPFGTGNGFSSDVAIAGDTLLVGAPRTLQPVEGASPDEDGTVHRYTLSGGAATYAGELVPRDFELSYDDLYGETLDAGTDDRFVTGAPAGNFVIVWERDTAGVWFERLRIEPSAGMVSGFGRAVAADGDIIVVSANTDSTGKSGAVFVIDLTP